MAQAPSPSRPIARSFDGPGLLSHVMVSKYLDHQPLYRQCQIFGRENVDLSESTMGDWVGGSPHLLRPLIDALQRYVFSSARSDERRVGKECVSTCSFRWSTYH